MSLDFYLHYEIDGNEISVLSKNITHNLVDMAQRAGVYYALWKPEEIGCKTAKEVIEILEIGLSRLKKYPEVYKKFDAPNGWGMYEHFVPFVEEVLEGCKKYPNAVIKISR